MVKRVDLPSDALDDVRALLRLSAAQLTKLDELFSTAESAFPLRETFINQVAETLKVSIDDARSVVMVCHFLLLHSEAHDDEDIVSDVLRDVREFLENLLAKDESRGVLASFDENRDTLKSLATPKPAPLRARKIERLASGPERRIDSIRTICQLRPLFEGPENDERIVGVVPSILLEIESVDDDDDSSTVVFSIDDKKLTELEEVIQRTREKLEAIRQRYASDLLTPD